MFDREEWRVAKDSEARVYCGVINNTVVVSPARKREYEVYIKAPSDLFPYLQNVCGLSVEELRRSHVSFYLDEADSVWYFGMLLPTDEHIDLWIYRDLPGWAYRV